MKSFLKILFLLLPIIGFSQPTQITFPPANSLTSTNVSKSASITYITGSSTTPSWNPNLSLNKGYSEFCLNKTNNKLYIWNTNNVKWTEYGLVARISGTGTPNYTPDNTNELAVNANGDLFTWNLNAGPAAWKQITGGGTTYTAGTGLTLVSSTIFKLSDGTTYSPAQTSYTKQVKTWSGGTWVNDTIAYKRIWYVDNSVDNNAIFSITTSSGSISTATIVNGGSGYPASVGFTVTIVGGNNDGKLNITTNANGNITGISSVFAGGTGYVNNTNIGSYSTSLNYSGSDLNPGNTEQKPFKTLARAYKSLKSGDVLLLKSGCRFRESLITGGVVSGTLAKEINGLYIGKYGGDINPIVDGSDIYYGSWSSLSNAGGSGKTLKYAANVSVDCAYNWGSSLAGYVNVFENSISNNGRYAYNGKGMTRCTTLLQCANTPGGFYIEATQNAAGTSLGGSFNVFRVSGSCGWNQTAITNNIGQTQSNAFQINLVNIYVNPSDNSFPDEGLKYYEFTKRFWCISTGNNTTIDGVDSRGTMSKQASTLIGENSSLSNVNLWDDETHNGYFGSGKYKNIKVYDAESLRDGPLGTAVSTSGAPNAIGTCSNGGSITGVVFYPYDDVADGETADVEDMDVLNYTGRMGLINPDTTNSVGVFAHDISYGTFGNCWRKLYFKGLNIYGFNTAIDCNTDTLILNNFNLKYNVYPFGSAAFTLFANNGFIRTFPTSSSAAGKVVLPKQSTLKNVNWFFDMSNGSSGLSVAPGIYMSTSVIQSAITFTNNIFISHGRKIFLNQNGGSISLTVSGGVISSTLPTSTPVTAGSGYPASSTFNLPIGGSGTGGVVSVTTNTSGGIATVNSVVSGGSGYTNGAPITLFPNYGSLTLKNSVLFIDSATANVPILDLRNSSNSYTGDYNVFYSLSSLFRAYSPGNATVCTALGPVGTAGTWQNVTGQDANSVYLTAAQAATFWLNKEGVVDPTAPNSGIFIINPNCSVTWGDGTVHTNLFADGVTPITRAGSINTTETPIDYFVKKPTNIVDNSVKNEGFLSVTGTTGGSGIGTVNLKSNTLGSADLTLNAGTGITFTTGGTTTNPTLGISSSGSTTPGGATDGNIQYRYGTTLFGGDNSFQWVNGATAQSFNSTPAQGSTTPYLNLNGSIVMSNAATTLRVPNGTTAQRSTLTNAAGAIYYNSDYDSYEGLINGAGYNYAQASGSTLYPYVPFSARDGKVFEMIEDWPSLSGTHGWTSSLTGQVAATAAIITATGDYDSDHPGQLKLTLPIQTSAGGAVPKASLYQQGMGIVAVNSAATLNKRNFSIEHIIYMPALPTSGVNTDYEIVIGAANQNSAVFNDVSFVTPSFYGYVFRILSSAVSTANSNNKVACYASNGATNTVVYNSPSLTAAAWHRFRIEVIEGTSATYFIDDTQVANITSTGSLPVTGAGACWPYIEYTGIGSTGVVTTAAQSIYLDYSKLRIFTTGR